MKLWIVDGLYKYYYFLTFFKPPHFRVTCFLTCSFIWFNWLEYFYNPPRCSSTIRSASPLNLLLVKTPIPQVPPRMSPSDPLLWGLPNPSILLPLGAASRTQAGHCTAAAQRWCSQIRPLIPPTPACLYGTSRSPHSPSSVRTRGKPWTSTHGCWGTDIWDIDSKVRSWVRIRVLSCSWWGWKYENIEILKSVQAS